MPSSVLPHTVVPFPAPSAPLDDLLPAATREVRLVIDLRAGDEVTLARVLAALGSVANAEPAERTGSPVAPPPASSDPFVFDADARTLMVEGQPVHLTYTEFELLFLLVSAPGRVLSRAELRQRLWNTSYDGGNRTIDVHIGRIRRKLGTAGEFLEAVPRVGYRWTGSGLRPSARPRALQG